MKQLLLRLAENLDQAFLATRLRLFGEKSGIRGLLFHTVFLNSSELEKEEALPQQRLTISNYEEIFEYFLSNGYQFLAYSDLQNTIEDKKNYVYVTFDDGYFNNVRIVPLIEKLNIPIHIFVTTRNLEENKKFWWDVVYENRTRQGWPLRRIKREINKLKTHRTAAIDEFILGEFGSKSYVPKSDLDRPFSPKELAQLSKNRLVTVGSHTHTHAIATRITKEEFRTEILQSEKIFRASGIEEIKGFAFPNGEYSEDHFDILEESGFWQGFSAEERLFYVGEQFLAETKYRLGRFSLSATMGLEYQCKIVRAGGSPLGRMKRSRIAQAVAG
jgi:peptidoglycan/xylan/chitin deacetylase (PgdA/CDA1 family)